MKFILLLLTGMTVLHCSTLETTAQPDTPAIAPLDMLESVNTLRAQGCRCGGKRMPAVPPLSWDERLATAALRHANDMSARDFFSHQGSDGSNVSTRAKDAGFQWRQVGENIAYNYPNATAVVQGWQESPAHCKNLMSADFQQMGAAQKGGYWVQVLGRE